MQSLRSFCTISAASLLSIVLAGCGLGTPAPSTPESGVLPAFTGIVHGGSMPIIGATVTLYVTASNGYGGAATSLATTMTGSYGQFTFGSYTYPSTSTTQQAYMTVSGGNAGTYTTNSNILLMAALGPATNFDSQTAAQAVQVYISEASTVAAAYALSNFITDASGVVNVSAPSNNNAVTAACVSGYSMTCTASGLPHAFQNAANLVNSYTTGSPGASFGLANSVVPGNSSGSVPQALINYLANALTACTNSTGGVASNTSTSCGKLFAATTPPSGTAPTDTLQAAINMAKYPTNNVTLIANIPAPSAPFNPTLTTAPTDLSMAIVYTNSQPASPATSAPYFLALDAQDNVFVAVKDSTPSSGVMGLSSNGTLLFPYTTNSSTTYVTPFAVATDNIGHVWLTDTITQGTPVAGGDLGYGTIRGFYTGTISGTTAGAVYTTLTGTASTGSADNGTPGATTPSTVALGSAETKFSGIGIDRNNDIWACKNGGNGTFRFNFTAGTSGSTPDTYTDAAAGAAYALNFSTGCTDIKFDNFQDALLAGYSGTSSGGQTGFFVNVNGSTAAPLYSTATNVKSNTITANVGSLNPNGGPAGTTTGVICASMSTTQCGITGGLAVAAPSSSVSGTITTTVFGAYTSGAAGTYYSSDSAAYNTTGPALTQTVTSNTKVLTDAVAAESYPEFDGSGALWVPSYSSTGNLQYGTPSSSSPPTATALAPCYLPAATTTCATASAASDANVVQIDSTGSVWTISLVNGGVLTQIIGTAAPTWPAYYYAMSGTKPQ